jgi:cellulose synthase/poly-beta-1,6-N-acetylglucosamine synthase-like glycosyltransferase
MNFTSWALLFGLVVVPLLSATVDIIPATRATRGVVFPLPKDRRSVSDFTVLVPIYGHIKYLENVEFLRPYGARVVLVTTTSESAEFNAALDRVASETGFQIFRTHVRRNPAGNGRRRTAGTVRDQIIRDASECFVRSEYVVCIDADTVTERPIGEMVGALAANELDFASVRLVPSNTERLLGRLQGHEYRMVMRLRRILPWVCSGACHLGRTEAHREIMRRHSLFFQGNDVELGLIGKEMGYRIGHLAFDVPTTVPDSARAWIRQRIAWSGGEFRLFIANPQLVRRHPFYVFYGAIVVIVMVPLRWLCVVHPGLDLITVFAIYWTLLVLVNWRHRDRALLIYPFYGMFISLFLVPIGVVSYFMMAMPEGNYGRIRLAVHRVRHRRGAVPAARALARSESR